VICLSLTAENLMTDALSTALHTSKVETPSAQTVTTLESADTPLASCGVHSPVYCYQLSSSAWLERGAAKTKIRTRAIPRTETSLAGGAGAQGAGEACGKISAK
jgi:hypothetical protein